MKNLLLTSLFTGLVLTANVSMANISPADAKKPSSENTDTKSESKLNVLNLNLASTDQADGKNQVLTILVSLDLTRIRLNKI